MPVPDPKAILGSKKFNLFGPPKTSDIQVGYISTDRGYVQGANICEANSYAKLNPGTTFIIKNRNEIQYKNINEVNELKPDDVFVRHPLSGEPIPEGDANKCPGIQVEKECGPTTVEFYGGGGVGVKANPVIGVDGSVMAVHIVSGGHGYQYPPLVEIKDPCMTGGGVVAQANLGETVKVEEVYSTEDEFEEYFPDKVGQLLEGKSVKQFCEEERIANDAGYGRRYSPDGKDLGPWDPSVYVTFKEDPLRRQIDQFQEYLSTLTDPWWFVRKQAPLTVVSDDENEVTARQKKLNLATNRTVYPVQHWEWGGSQIKVKPDQGTIPTHDPGAFLDEIFQIYTQGGHGRGLQFTFTEVGGDHVFVVKADDYKDSGEARELTKTIKPNVDYKVVSEGGHGGRDRKKGTEQGLLKDGFGRRGAEKGLGTSSMIFADLIGTNNDNDDLQILAKKGKFRATNKTKRSGHSNYDLTYRLNVPFGPGSTTTSSQDVNTGIVTKVNRSFMNDHAISPVPMSNAPGSDFAGMLFTMEWEEEFPYPGEYTFKGQCDNVARAYLDNQPLMPKVATWKDKPTIVKKNLDWEDSDKKGKVYKIKLDLLNGLQYHDVTVQEPPQKDTTENEYEDVSTATAKFDGSNINDLALVVSGAGTAECTLLLDTNDNWRTSGLAVREMRCGSITLTRSKGRKRETLTGTAKFPAGRYPIEIIGASGGAGARIVSSTVRGHDSAGLFKREGISTSGIADTRIELDDDASGGFDINVSINLRVNSVKPEKRRLKPPAKPKPTPTVAGIKVQKVFNTVDWMTKANRQLWRTNVVSNAGFINASGVCPFDTGKELDTNPYAGTHEIIWNNLNFPIDGNYTIKVEVDDAVDLKFTGPSGEVSLRKEGFIGGVGDTHSTGSSTYTRFFKRGSYTLKAGLEQIPGGRFGFRKDAKGKKIKDKEVRFRVTTAAAFANKITIPGLFSIGKEYKGADLNQTFLKNVEVGKEYNVVVTSDQSKRVRLRIKDGGKRLEMEEYKDNDWQDLVCTVTEGQFYGIQGNTVKFKLSESVKGINPMALAVDIEVAYATKTVVSAKSWHENPLGVAFTIKAPLPPIPKEDPPKQEGRCPNNPMWTTRFPADKQWYPVRHEPLPGASESKGWSEFLNRWAISPALPLPTPGSDEGGKVFTNTWDVDIPYDGFYQLKGEVDDIARYYVNGELKLDLSRRKNKTSGQSKFFLTQGLKKFKVEVENYSTITYKNVNKKIFSARDWKRKTPVAPPPKAAGGIICHAGGGKGGTDNQEQLVGGKVIVGQGGEGGPGGDDNMYGRHHGGRGGGAGLRNGGHSTNTLSHTQIDAMGSGKYKGGPGGFGVNFQGSQVGTIQQTVTKDSTNSSSSGGDGVAMGGGGGGGVRANILSRGGHGGNGGVKITWGLTGKSQEWTTPGNYEVTVPGNIGKAKTSNTVPVTARFEGTTRDNLELVVSGTGKAECTIRLDTNDKWSSKGVALTAMKCGSISLTRTKGRKSETLSGTGTFVGGKRYKVEIIGADKNARPARIGETRVELLDRHKDDTNASLNLSVSSALQPMDGVTIVCIGGGGSGFKDQGGDKQGSGGSGGAYAWVNKDIAAGQKLKIVVGKGGQGTNVQGGNNGGDSYVEIISEPPPPSPEKIIEQQKGQVTYKGPNLFHFTDNRWGKVMNEFSVSPANPDANLDQPSPNNVGRKILEWSNVDFPFKGQYNILFVADNKAKLYINGSDTLFANENFRLKGGNTYDSINISSPGKYTIRVELDNTFHANSPTPEPGDDVFRNNPCGVVLEIKKDVNVATDTGKSWTENPIGVSGILVPPPCPKEVGGKGVVKDVVINDPGNGFTPAPPSPDETQYPVALKLKKVRPTVPGINYDCAKDTVVMTPDLGYKLAPVCGPFGEIVDIIITPPIDIPPKPSAPETASGGRDDPSVPGDDGSVVTFNRTPEIWIESATGINAVLKPEFEIVVVPPLEELPPGILQVTDLAGIKQTGYYNGKPYYGAVFYENGIKYAGWYATAGQPIQIYDTLQESIDATVTTPPSAIQRQGSDVSSNDPRLDIPGTPQNLT